MRQRIFIWTLALILFMGFNFKSFGQDPDCVPDILRKGDDFMSKEDYGNAMLQYASAFSCENVSDFTSVRKKINEVINRLVKAREKAEDSEERAQENLKIAIAAQEKAERERKAKDSALTIATINAKRAEALLMTALAQNRINQGDDWYNAMLLAYGGYMLVDEEASESAYNTYLKAAYNVYDGLVFVSDEAIENYQPLLSEDQLLVHYQNNLALLNQSALPRIIDPSCPVENKLSFSARTNSLTTWGYVPGYNLYNSSNTDPYQVKVHTQPVISLIYTSDGSYVVSGARDHTIGITPVSGGETKMVRDLDGNVYEMIPHPNTSQFLTRSSNGSLRMWNINGTPQASFGDSFFQCAAFSNDGTHIAAVDANGNVSIWNTNGESIASFTDPVLNTAEELVFVGDGQRLAIRTDHNVIIINKESGKEHQIPYLGKVNGLKISPSGSHLLTWTDRGELSLVNLNPWDTIYPQGTAEILDASFSPDGQYVLSTDVEGTVILRDLDGRKLHTWNVDPIHPIPAQFSHDSLALYIVENGNRNIRRLILPDLLLKAQQETISAYIPDYEKLAQQYGLHYVSEVWKE